MLIAPARQHSPFSLVLIPVLAGMLWIPAFIHPIAPDPVVDMPLYHQMDIFFREYPYVAVTIGLLLLIGEAFLFNYILQQHQVVVKKNWLAALLVVVFGSCSAQLLWPGPVMISALFVLMMVHVLLGTYRQDKSFSAVFNGGLLLGIATQFYFPSLVLFLLALIMVIMLRPFIWREWLILMIGAALPFIYGGVYYYWTGTLQSVTDELLIGPIRNRSFFLKLDESYYFFTAVTALLLLISTGRLVGGAQASTLKTKKGVSVMVWFCVIALLTIIPAQNFNAGTFRFLVFPVAFLATNYFLNARRGWIAELVFTLLVGGIAVMHLLQSGWTL